jgi:hypothetical protein
VLLQIHRQGKNGVSWLAKDCSSGKIVKLMIYRVGDVYKMKGLKKVRVMQYMQKQRRSEKWSKICQEFIEVNFIGIDNSIENFCSNMLNCFVYKGTLGKHLCIVENYYQHDLYDYVKELDILENSSLQGNDEESYQLILKNLYFVLKVLFQISIGLKFLHNHCEIIHSDLSLKNIFLEFKENNCENQIIDKMWKFKENLIKKKFKPSQKRFKSLSNALHEHNKNEVMSGKIRFNSVKNELIITETKCEVEEYIEEQKNDFYSQFLKQKDCKNAPEQASHFNSLMFPERIKLHITSKTDFQNEQIVNTKWCGNEDSCPEDLLGFSKSYLSDVWNFGLIGYYMIFKKNFFEKMNSTEITKDISSKRDIYFIKRVRKLVMISFFMQSVDLGFIKLSPLARCLKMSITNFFTKDELISLFTKNNFLKINTDKTNEFKHKISSNIIHKTEIRESQTIKSVHTVEQFLSILKFFDHSTYKNYMLQELNILIYQKFEKSNFLKTFIELFYNKILQRTLLIKIEKRLDSDQIYENLMTIFKLITQKKSPEKINKNFRKKYDSDFNSKVFLLREEEFSSFKENDKEDIDFSSGKFGKQFSIKNKQNDFEEYFRKEQNKLDEAGSYNKTTT